MNKYNPNVFAPESKAPQLKAGSMANAFMSRVFSIMTLGLGITGATSWLFASKYLVDAYGAAEFFSGGMGIFLMFSPLIFVLILSFGISRMNYLWATVSFIAFAVVMGLSMSYIFFAYSLGSIFQVFLISAGTFAAMALIGATTKVDLTKMGGILFMALIGLIIASVVNIFIGATWLDMGISAIGVLIFCGLTAYDTQKLLRIGAQVGINNESANKMAVLGALSLYLDFINLFLFLLRLFGGRD